MSRVARLGAFIVFTLAVLAAGVFIIGSKEYLFRSTYLLKTQFDNVVGLSEGADVQVGGVHSGTVEAIVLPLKPGGKVTVVMELNKSTHAIIKQDSVASIETQGVLGNQYIAISFGSVGQADVMNGQIIQSEPPFQMADMLEKASGILDNSQKVTAHMSSISAKIDSGQGTVGALINDKQLYDNLEQTTASLQTTMLQAQVGVTDFQANMEALKHNFLLRGYFKKRGYEDSADLETNTISELPQGMPVKEFTFSGMKLFDKRDSAELKNQKSLDAAGEFLERNQFGVAVVVASAGMEGDAQKDLVLTEARAMVVRQYLVNNYAFDDSQFKTMGMGKQTDTDLNAEWGAIQILIFPTGTGLPADKPMPGAIPAATDVVRPVQVTVDSSQKP